MAIAPRKIQSGPAGQGRSKAGKRLQVAVAMDSLLLDAIEGVISVARELDWDLNLAGVRLREFLPPGPFDGIVTMVYRKTLSDWIAGQDCPVVRIIGSAMELPYPAVLPDDPAAGRMGSRFLLGLGYEHLAFLRVGTSGGTTMMRDEFAKEVAAAGRRMHFIDAPDEGAAAKYDIRSLAQRREWMAAHLRRLPHPIAVMTADDRFAMDLVFATRLAGLRVPQDVAVLGCDHHPHFEKLCPVPLSYVETNHREVGRRAALHLAELMRAGRRAMQHPPEIVLVPPSRVEARDSTASFVCPHPGIARAVLHVRGHFREPMTLATVARVAGLPERALNEHFRRALGHGMHEELTACRLACAEKLLRETDLKLAAIAVECGFGGDRQLRRIFSERHRTTPKEWREKWRAVGN
jgi:LacI family transcriptional regulator